MILARPFKAGRPDAFRTASRSDGLWSVVADATRWTLLTLIPALKRRAKLMPTPRVEEPFGFLEHAHPNRDTSASILSRDLILLQLPVRHFISPSAQSLLRKLDHVHAQRHPAAQTLRRLHE
jgi:hypothetical protein